METKQCDVLVVGGGLAGTWAALRARACGARVILAEGGLLAKSSVSSHFGGHTLCPAAGDDLDLWAREIVEHKEYLVDQDWVRVILQEQGSRLKDMADWGVWLARNERGHLVRTAAMGNVITRQIAIRDDAFMEPLRKKMAAEGVQFLERTYISGLLTSDGCHPTGGSVVGAFGFNTRSGEPLVIKAGATVLTTGSTQFNYGDGIAQAFRAGAELQDMEFSHTVDSGAAELDSWVHIGVIIRNAAGENLMERYYPELRGKWSRRQAGIAVATEIAEGRGPCYADFSQCSPEQLHWFETTLPCDIHTIQKWAEQELDFRQDRLELKPRWGSVTIRGAIRVNIYAETNLGGLYAAGAATPVVVMGNPTANCCVGGYRAGESAARYAREGPSQEVKEEQVDMLNEETFKPLKRKGGINPLSLKDELTKTHSPANISLFRTKKGLETILSQAEKYRKQVANLAADDLLGVAKANRVMNYFLFVELFARASLEREETRGCHLRPDFPYRDDINWLKWVILKQEGDNTSIARLPLPIYRWPVKPPKYEQIPYPYTMLEE